MVNDNKIEKKLTKDYESNDKERIEYNESDLDCKGLTDKEKEMDKFWNWEYSNEDN
ncbi:MAG: hypothetical protein GX889_00425 [Clostridiales bacterium]|nr:hypothetical protein [Clostridiales bacterium]